MIMEGWEPILAIVLTGLAVTEVIDARRSGNSDDIGWAVILGFAALGMVVYTLVLLFR